MKPIDLRDDAPINDVDEQLVAYLDGELPVNDVHELERRLASDDALRARLRQLQTGWDLLDQLPNVQSSQSLLETTIRMAAINGNAEVAIGKSVPVLERYPAAIGFAVASAACLLVGLGAVRFWEYAAYQRQLRELPTALHLDAYLHASDRELIRLLESMPQWHEANQIADRLEVWDFSVVDEVEAANVSERQTLLPALPIESQELIRAAWDRYEKISPSDADSIRNTVSAVESQTDGKSLLRTMDRFAAWRQTLSAQQRDLLDNGDEKTRRLVIAEALDETTLQWTRQRGRALSDHEVETIYLALRQIARIRIDAVRAKATADTNEKLDSIGFGQPTMDPRIESTFLRRLFDSRSADERQFTGENPTQDEPNDAPPDRQISQPSGRSPDGSVFAAIRQVVGTARGPLREDELYMMMSVLPKNLADVIADAEGIPSLQQGLLRGWADESLRRTQWSRSGRTVLERYQARDAEERETIDLLPTDQLLRSLQSEERR